MDKPVPTKPGSQLYYGLFPPTHTETGAKTFGDRLIVLSIIAAQNAEHYFVDSVLIAPLITNVDKITPL